MLDWALVDRAGFLCLSLTLTVVRIWKGRRCPSRVLGLDVLTSSSIGLIAVIGIDTGFTLYVDIAIALGLVGFPRHRVLRPASSWHAAIPSAPR